MASDQFSDGVSRGPVPAAFSERQWLATVVLAGCAGLTTLALAVGPFPHEPAQRLPLAVMACAPIVWLRRRPLPVLAVTAAASGLLVAASGHASLPLATMTGLAVYFVASRRPRRVSVPAAVAAAVTLGAPLLYAVLTGRAATPGPAAVTGFLPIVAAWFTGDSVAARRRYVAGLAEQERAAEAERARRQIRDERVRIARELHDVIAHTLAVITVQAGVGRRLAGRNPEEASSALESIETIGRTAQDELRVVLGLLRDEEAAAAALAPAPALADLKELAENVRASGTPVELRTSGADRQLSPALELSLYRVVQEALTNVVKHAPGARASVDLTVGSRLVRLEVADHGGPAGHLAADDGQPAVLVPGQGIVGMRERVSAFGGWLVAEPLTGRGFHVLAEIPVEGMA